MVAEVLDSLKIDNELTDEELDLIENLNLESFDKDKNIDNMTEMQTALKATTIEIAWEEEKLTLYNIATKFDEYVEQWEWWKLQIKDWLSNPPSWIANIIENPKNNDLAYLVQKIAWLISYKTARQYTEKQLDAVEVTIDKTFGNQTRRALSWLKKWIENDQDYKDIDAWQEYAMKYIGTQFIDWLISDKVDNDAKNKALSKYHLQYNNGEILPADWYEFIDPYSNNYAVRSKDSNVAKWWSNTAVDENSEIIQDSTENKTVETYTEKINDINVAEDIKEEIKNEGIYQIKFYNKVYDLSISYPQYDYSVSAHWESFSWSANTYDGLVFGVGEVSTKIPLNEFLNKDGEFDIQYWKTIILPKVTDILKEKLTAFNIAEAVRGMKFRKTDIFPEKIKNKPLDSKIKNYFYMFKNQELLIDKGPEYTYANGSYVCIRLNDSSWRDKAYHNPKNNPDLAIKASELINTNWWLDKETLKVKLRGVVENIVKNYF